MEPCTVLTLRESIDKKIEESGPAIVDRVVEQFAETERKRRSDLIVAAVNAIRQGELDQRKLDKPDQVHYNADGSVATQHYTKGKIDEIKKAKERSDRMTAALNGALATHSPDAYKKLEEVMKKGGGKPGTEASEE